MLGPARVSQAAMKPHPFGVYRLRGAPLRGDVAIRDVKSAIQLMNSCARCL